VIAVTRDRKLILLAAVAIGASVAVFVFVPAIAQDPAYHGFADVRTWLGVSRLGDVVSNVAFLLAGLGGFGVSPAPQRVAHSLHVHGPRRMLGF